MVERRPRNVFERQFGVRQPVEQKPAEGNPDAKPGAAERGESLLVVRVPEARLDTAIDQVCSRMYSNACGRVASTSRKPRT